MAKKNEGRPKQSGEPCPRACPSPWSQGGGAASPCHPAPPSSPRFAPVTTRLPRLPVPSLSPFSSLGHSSGCTFRSLLSSFHQQPFRVLLPADSSISCSVSEGVRTIRPEPSVPLLPDQASRGVPAASLEADGVLFLPKVKDTNLHAVLGEFTPSGILSYFQIVFLKVKMLLGL